MGSEADLTLLVQRAQQGHPDSLSALIRAVQDDVFHLSLRMLVRPEDAEDATQEILIRVTTRLSTFEGRSAFRTWVYRVAMNYLLTSRQVREREPGLSFDAFAADLADGLVEGVADETAVPADDLVLLNELRVACTMAMLLCLDLNHRAAYLLGCVLEWSHQEAAAALDISADNFRQRLARARKEVEAFTARACGLVNEQAACSCPRRLPAAVARGRVRRPLAYSGDAEPSFSAVRQDAQRLVQHLRTIRLQQATPAFRSPRDFGAAIHELLRRA